MEKKDEYQLLKIPNYYLGTPICNKEEDCPLIFTIEEEIEKAQFIVKCSRDANAGNWEAKDLPVVYFNKKLVVLVVLSSLAYVHG